MRCVVTLPTISYHLIETPGFSFAQMGGLCNWS